MSDSPLDAVFGTGDVMGSAAPATPSTSPVPASFDNMAPAREAAAHARADVAGRDAAIAAHNAALAAQQRYAEQIAALQPQPQPQPPQHLPADVGLGDVYGVIGDERVREMVRSELDPYLASVNGHIAQANHQLVASALNASEDRAREAWGHEAVDAAVKLAVEHGLIVHYAHQADPAAALMRDFAEIEMERMGSGRDFFAREVAGGAVRKR